VHYARGEYAQARASYQVAMERTRDPVLIGRFLLNLGVIANIEGDLENALWHYLRARALFRDNGDRTSEALALHNLGMIHADREEWDSAADAYGQCLVLCEQQGNRQMIANVLLNESEVLVARRDFTAAVRNCELAMSIYTDIGDEVGRGEAHRWRGYAQRVAGDLEAAERSLNEAVLAGQRLRARLLEAEACREMAALRRGHADAARWRERAVALFRDLGARRELDAMEREAGES
jgi:tetratricopeptide (TPR) repeat protein